MSTRERLARRLFRALVRLNRLLYQLSGGGIGGRMRGAPVLLLTTTGRRSGRSYTTPLLFLADTNDYIVVASNGGAPRHPDWFLNLEANPEVEVQVRRELKRMRARIAGPEERARLWPRLVALYPPYESYRDRTSREIPVVVLELRG